MILLDKLLLLYGFHGSEWTKKQGYTQQASYSGQGNKGTRFNCDESFVPVYVCKKLFCLKIENEARDEEEARHKKTFHFGACRQASIREGEKCYDIENNKVWDP